VDRGRRRDRRHQPGRPGYHRRRRSVRQRGVRPRIQQLLPESRRAQRAAGQGRQAAGADYAGTRRARRRGSARDGQRRPGRHPRRRQPQGVVLAARLAEAETLSDRGSQARRSDRVGNSQEQPAARDRAQPLSGHERAELAERQDDLPQVQIYSTPSTGRGPPQRHRASASPRSSRSSGSTVRSTKWTGC
jgi:hypothetical protein